MTATEDATRARDSGNPVLWSALSAALVVGACVGGVETVDITRADISGPTASADYVVTASLSGEDLSSLVEAEIYAQIVVTECGNESIRYPASPRLADTSLNDFSVIRAMLNRRGRNENYEMQSEIPPVFIQRLRSACVRLEGGSYLGRSLRSNEIRVTPTGTR